MPYLFTIGYEGLNIDQFIRLLLRYEIDTLVDVRQMPLSRKKGFSKSALSEIVRTEGIDYIHTVAMGCPKPIRDAFKTDGNWNRYTTDFLTYLDTRDDEVDELVCTVREKRCCLLCFEANPAECHRSYVAARVADRMDETCEIVNIRSTDLATSVRLKVAA